MYVLVNTEKPNDTRIFESLDALKEWLIPVKPENSKKNIISTIKGLLNRIQTTNDDKPPLQVSNSEDDEQDEQSSPEQEPTEYTKCADKVFNRMTRRDDPKAVNYVKTDETIIDSQFETNVFTSISISKEYGKEFSSTLSTEFTDTINELKEYFIQENLLEKICVSDETDYMRFDTTCIEYCFKLWILYPEIFTCKEKHNTIQLLARTIKTKPTITSEWISKYKYAIVNETGEDSAAAILRIYDKKYLTPDVFNIYFSILDTVFNTTRVVKSTHLKHTVFMLLYNYYNFSLNHTHLHIFIQHYINEKITHAEKTDIQSSLLYESFMSWFKYKYRDVLSNANYSTQPSLYEIICGIFTNKRFTILFEEITGLKTLRKSGGNFWPEIGFIKNNAMPLKVSMKDTGIYQSEYLAASEVDTIYATIDWSS